MDEANVRRRARDFVSQVGAVRIGGDLTPYAAAVNARVLKESLGAGESGYAMRTPKGKYIITVNASESERRQRFTIGHEIGHIVLELPSDHQAVPSWHYAKRHINESACDVFASELLMPYRQWRTAVPAGHPTLDVIRSMAELFGTSFPAAASRYAFLSENPCAFVTMEAGTVRHMARSACLRTAGAWVRPRSVMPPGSVAHRLRSGGSTMIDKDIVAQDIWFENWDKGLDLWEMARHYGPSDTTVSLLWFDSEDLPEDERPRISASAGADQRVDLAELTGELPWPGRRRRS